MSTTPVVHLELWISPLIFKKKFETSLMGYSGACGKLFHDENLKLKISWHCPLSWFQNYKYKTGLGFEKSLTVNLFCDIPSDGIIWVQIWGLQWKICSNSRHSSLTVVYEIINLLYLKRYTLGSRNCKQKPSKPVIPASKSIEWFIEDQTFLRSFISFGSSLTTFSLFLSVCRLSSLYWQERSGKGWGRSQIIRPLESLALFK